MGFLSRFLKKKPEHVREPRFAGHLYPEAPEELTHQITQSMADAPTQARQGALKAMIVPFAQLDYISDLLGTCWKRAGEERESIKRVILLGSALRIPFQGVAMSTSDAWRTPLGELWLDEVWREQITTTEMLRGLEAVHEHESALELQLPYAQLAMPPDITILPLLMGDGSTDDMLHVLKLLLAREGTLLVISTELAYGAGIDEGDALITRVRDSILAHDADSIARGDVTARHPVRALLKLAKEQGWQSTYVGHTTSRALQEARHEQLAVQDQGLMTGYAGFIFEQT